MKRIFFFFVISFLAFYGACGACVVSGYYEVEVCALDIAARRRVRLCKFSAKVRIFPEMARLTVFRFFRSMKFDFSFRWAGPMWWKICYFARPNGECPVLASRVAAVPVAVRPSSGKQYRIHDILTQTRKLRPVQPTTIQLRQRMKQVQVAITNQVLQ